MNQSGEVVCCHIRWKMIKFRSFLQNFSTDQTVCFLRVEAQLMYEHIKGKMFSLLKLNSSLEARSSRYKRKDSCTASYKRSEYNDNTDGQETRTPQGNVSTEGRGKDYYGLSEPQLSAAPTARRSQSAFPPHIYQPGPLITLMIN